MSDVSKTSELIAALRKAQDAAGSIPHGTMDHETQWLPFANLYNAADALLDALEAATRDPVQGEPNDDREALIAVFERTPGDEPGALEGARPGEMHRAWSDYMADAILAAGFSRATVPDAATEGILRIARRDALSVIAADAVAERDAALAAIERVRGVADTVCDHLTHPVNDELRAALRDAVSDALDGAPEPEDVRALAEAEVRKTPAEGNPISEPGVTKDIAFVRGAVFGAAQGDAPQAPAINANCMVDADGCEAGTGMTGAAPQAESACIHEIAQYADSVTQVTVSHCVKCGHVAPAAQQVSVTYLARVIAGAVSDWSRQRLEFWRRPLNVEPPGDCDSFIACAVLAALNGFDTAATEDDDERAQRVRAAQKSVWAEIHAQPADRMYSVAEVKQLTYSLDNAIADAMRISVQQVSESDLAELLADHGPSLEISTRRYRGSCLCGEVASDHPGHVASVIVAALGGESRGE